MLQLALSSSVETPSIEKVEVGGTAVTFKTDLTVVSSSCVKADWRTMLGAPVLNKTSVDAPE